MFFFNISLESGGLFEKYKYKGGQDKATIVVVENKIEPQLFSLFIFCFLSF